MTKLYTPEEKDTLVAGLVAWIEDNEGSPSTPADANLMKVVWRVDGDRDNPCDECDGDCGEPCAPITAEAACRALDQWKADYWKRHGIIQS